jgi:hypothetical protein
MDQRTARPDAARRRISNIHEKFGAVTYFFDV